MAGRASGAGSTLLLMMSLNIGGVILRIASSPNAPCISIAPFIASFVILYIVVMNIAEKVPGTTPRIKLLTTFHSLPSAGMVSGGLY